MYFWQPRNLPFLRFPFLLIGFLVFGAACSIETEPANELVIYAARNENLISPLIRQFRDDTGIDVQVKYGSTSGLVTTLKEEGQNSPADLFYTRDPGGLATVSDLMTPLPSDILEKVPERAASPDGAWVGTSARARVVVYNTDSITGNELPDALEGFADPIWRGRIGWSPTSGPTQTMITAMRVLWGEDATREWLNRFLANEPVFFNNHTATVAGVGAGEVDVGLVNHYYLLRFLEENGEDFPARNYHMRDGGPGNLVMIVGVGVLKTSKNRENAEAFIRFLLSEGAQKYLTDEAYDYPILEGVEANELLVPLRDVNTPEIEQSLLDDIESTQALLREVGAIP